MENQKNCLLCNEIMVLNESLNMFRCPICNISMFKSMNIKPITDIEGQVIIETREPKGLFYLYDEKSNQYVGFDNRSGDCWVEDFPTKEKCIRWLLGK